MHKLKSHPHKVYISDYRHLQECVSKDIKDPLQN